MVGGVEVRVLSAAGGGRWHGWWGWSKGSVQSAVGGRGKGAWLLGLK